MLPSASDDDARVRQPSAPARIRPPGRAGAVRLLTDQYIQVLLDLQLDQHLQYLQVHLQHLHVLGP